MKAIVYIILAIIILLFLYNTSEYFTNTVRFVRRDNAEFRGINLLGINSDGSAVAVDSADKCETICRNNPACLGYGYYQPGQSCFLFTTGGFVDGRPGFVSGIKQ